MGLSENNYDPNDPIDGLNGIGGNPGWGGYGLSGGFFATGSGGATFAANPDAYAANLNEANQGAQSYYNQGANLEQQASPTANNATMGLSQSQAAQNFGAENALAGQLQGVVANPGSSQAAQQYQQSVQQAQQAQTAIGNSASGSLALAGARRSAQQQAAQTQAGSQAGLVQTEAGAQQQAASQLSSLYGQEGSQANQQLGLENQQAQQQAQLNQSQAQANVGMQQGLYGLSANDQSLATQSLTGYSNDLLGEAGASNSEQQVGNAFGNAVTGAGMSAIGTAYSGLSKSNFGGLGGSSTSSSSGGT